MASERKNSRGKEHPKILNPLSPKNNKQIIGINSIKEENGEESITFRERTENNNYGKCNFQNNKSNEEGDHSTSGSSKSQVSSSKSNNSTPEVCKLFNKNDNTPIENDDMLKITPHFINEKPNNRNIQLQFHKNNNNINKEKKPKYARPLTPNLNIIRKRSAPICQNNANKLISKINNDNAYLINECKKYLNNKDKNIYNNNKEKDFNKITDKNINYNMNINKTLSQEGIKTDCNIKNYSFSCTKNRILKKHNSMYMKNSLKENSIIKNIDNFNKKKMIKNTISNVYNSINNSNSYYNYKIPLPFNTNRNIQNKNNKINNQNYFRGEKALTKDYSKFSRKDSNTSLNKCINKKKLIKNFSRQNKKDVIFNNGLKPFRSENKITTVHSKVNDEINNLFSGLSDHIARDPEIQNKIESLIKDIKNIQHVVHIKTQNHFRPRNLNSINYRERNGYNCD